MINISEYDKPQYIKACKKTITGVFRTNIIFDVGIFLLFLILLYLIKKKAVPLQPVKRELQLITNYISFFQIL